MPRLAHALLRRAHRTNKLLPLLLRTCRDLRSARNELRWLSEHAAGQQESRSAAAQSLHRLCLDRSRGKPLQYILGNQPFGHLDILCRPGVLIPRPETETYTEYLVDRLRGSRETVKLRGLRIVDLCTGTGCIALQLYALLSPFASQLSVLGVDISPQALRLSNDNLQWNIRHGNLLSHALHDIRFVKGDVLQGDIPTIGSCDIVISNPPYISPAGFGRDTSRSVRLYEPKLALVPRKDSCGPTASDESIGDAFYPRLLSIARTLGAKLLIMEVADHAQARRVVQLVAEKGQDVWVGGEIWHDHLSVDADSGSSEATPTGLPYRSIGNGHGRAVVLWREEGRSWLEQQ